MAHAAEATAPTSPAILRLVSKLKGMSEGQPPRELARFIGSATTSTDLPERLEIAEAGVWFARHYPEWMQERALGISIFASSSQSPAIEELFSLLTASVEENEEQLFIPPLYPSLYRDEKSRNASPRDPPSFLYMKRRRELYEELCAISLQQPAWAEHVLRHLSNAWLLDGKPSEEEMRSYARNAVIACQSDLSNVKSVHWLLDSWISYNTGHSYSKDQRARLLKLALPVGVAALGESRPHNSRPPRLLDFIMDETQLHLGQSCTLMDELWRMVCDVEDPMARRVVFPYWAAYQFDLSDDISKCLHHADEFKTYSTDPCLLQEVISVTAPSIRWNVVRLPQQLRLAAFINTIVLETPALLHNEQTTRAVEEAAARFNRIHASPENTPLLERAREAHTRLLENLVAHSETSIDALFYLLRVKILNDTDTRELEKQLIAMAPAKTASMEEPLKRFISDANGSFQKQDDKNNKPQGYLDGCWDLKHRNAWLAAALRIGRELNKHYHSTKSDSWVEVWLNAAMKANWLAVPPVPSSSSYYVARRPEGGFDPLQFPPADLLRARDDLVIEGHELALSLTPPRGEFRDYTALLLARTPPDTAPIMRKLRQDPAKLGFMLYDLLNTCPDKLDSKLSAAGILETFIKEWPADNAHTEWVTSIRPCLLGLSVPILKGVWWNENGPLKNSDLQHTLPASQKRYATYLQLLHLAMQKPVLEARMFPDYAQVHLAQEPDLVLASAQRVLAHDPPRFYSGMSHIFSDTEKHAPPARRLEWVRLLLRLLPVLQKQNAAGSEQLTPWLGRFHFYCSVKVPEPKSPLWDELLTLHGQLVTGLTAHMEYSPDLLDPYATSQFAQGTSWEKVLQQIKSACPVDKYARTKYLKKLDEHTWGWCSTLRQRETTTKERLWSAEIMLGMTSLWPQDSHAIWVEHTSGMLVAAAKEDPACLEAVLDLQSRLISSLTPHQYALSALWDLGITLAQAGKSMEAFEQRCLAIVRANPRDATEVMADRLRRDLSSAELRIGGMPLMQSLLHVLQKWPEEAPVESYAWTRTLIHVAGDARSAGMDDDRVIGVQRKNPPPMPASSSKYIAFQTAILAELHRRQVQLPWMSVLELRLAWRTQADLHDFFSAPHRDATLAYLSEVLSFDLRNYAQWDKSRYGIQASKEFAPHRNAQETLEATHILLAATSQKLIDAATAQPLHQQSVRCMQRITELGQEVSKICSHVPDGTWSGAVHPSQAKEAAELKKLLESSPE